MGFFDLFKKRVKKFFKKEIEKEVPYMIEIENIKKEFLFYLNLLPKTLAKL